MRNKFENINLIGIIPGNGKSEAKTIDPYVDVLVDELLVLPKCQIYNSYKEAPVSVKIKLLLYVLDYPGMSKLFSQHGTGNLHGCHWCMLRGETCKELSKVIYQCNRPFLQHNDTLRMNERNFWNKGIDNQPAPVGRGKETDVQYREQYKVAKNKTAAIAKQTGCKDFYPLYRLPYHNRIEESLPDCMHTVKNVVKNLMDIISGRADIAKITASELKRERLHILTVSEEEACKCQLHSRPYKCTHTGDGLVVEEPPKKKKKRKEKLPVSKSISLYPFMLTREEIKLAQKRTQMLRTPVGFDLKERDFITKPGSMKSHNWISVASEGIIKFCLRGTLSLDCRNTLFLLCDIIHDLCAESQSLDGVDEVRQRLNIVLARLERDFPITMQNITTHLLRHIVDGINRFGPIYSTWMFVFERFNSWLCQRCLNKLYPEATCIQTYLIYDWCNYMNMSGKMPPHLEEFGLLKPQSGNDSHPFASNSANGKTYVVSTGGSLKSIHAKCNVVQGNCEQCTVKKYFKHEETHPYTGRVLKYDCAYLHKHDKLSQSSYVCVELKQGATGQKVTSGMFVYFGRIQFFILHTNTENVSKFALVKYYKDVAIDSETGLWAANSEHVEGRGSLVLIKSLSKPLLTASDENGKICFLNSFKQPFKKGTWSVCLYPYSISCNYHNNLIGSLERKCHFDDIFITCCTWSCHFNNFPCRQWWKFCPNDISISV